MAAILVTGGTGTLGRVLVPLPAEATHDVRVLYRRPSPRLPAGDAEVVVHAATNPRRRMRETEETGTRLVAAAAARGGAHLIYVSIVRVGRAPPSLLPGQAGGRADRRRVRGRLDRAPGDPVPRPHDRVLGIGWSILTRHLSFQPVDVGDVAPVSSS